MNDRHPNHPDNNRAHDPQTGEIDDGPVMEGEIIEPIGTGVLATIHRVEIDQQVATAKAYPRNVTQIKKELTALVTMDEDTADDCIYALPRGKKHIKGPSANFADALISFWGNARSGAFITQVNREEKFIEAIGSFQDVERNVIRQRRVRRSISTADGRIYNADMINMTGNAACRIAERNAITNGIPKSLWGPAYDQAFALVAGTTKTLGEKLERATKAFALHGISMDQVLQKIERQDISKVLPDDIVTMRGMLTALKTGEETVETIFGRGAGHHHETVQNPLKDEPAAEQAKTHPLNEGMRQAQEFINETERAKKADPITSGPQPTNDQRTRVAGMDHNRLSEEETAETVLTSQKAAEGSDKPAATEAQTIQTNAQAATSGPVKAVQTKAEPPYHDDETYMAYMRDRFDTAKGSSAVTELWGSTRDDRRELLSQDQIEELGKDKEAALKRLKLQGGKA